MTGLVKKTGKNNKDTYHFSPDSNFALLASDKNTIAGEDVLFIKQDYIENIRPDSPLYRMIHEIDKSKGQLKKVSDEPVDYDLIGYKYYKKLVSVSDKYTETKNDANKKKINKFPHLENDCLGFAECLSRGFTHIPPDTAVLRSKHLTELTDIISCDDYSRDNKPIFGECDEKNIQIALQTDTKYTNNNAVPEQGETYAIVTVNHGEVETTPFHATTVIYQTTDGKTNITLEAFAETKDQYPRFKLYTTDPDSEDTFHNNWMKDTSPGGFNKNPELPKITIVLKDKQPIREDDDIYVNSNKIAGGKSKKNKNSKKLKKTKKNVNNRPKKIGQSKI